MHVYWCKVARTEAEFEEIAKLNYETFVEEIPQHEANSSGARIDPFHGQNTYLIVLYNTELVGMIALRSERPFSLDNKIGKVENFLADLGKVCEIRLLAVNKQHRNGRVFFLLARALSDFCYEEGFDSAVISGTTRELKLYGQLGFHPFAEPVGTGDAVFIPMVTTRGQYGKSVAARLQMKRKLFHPGPVRLTEELAAPFEKEPVSHRSSTFQTVYEEVKGKLKQLAGAEPYLLSGSGTLANEAMLAQISLRAEKGVILVNGEFGKRLKEQAARWKLDFDVIEEDWGRGFSLLEVEQALKDGGYGWLLMVHGETSTGMLNDLEGIMDLCLQSGVKLCADCISSFGALPFSLKNCWLATAASGKAVGTMSGLAVVFADHVIEEDHSLPGYLDLGLYQNKIPFTLPFSLLKSFGLALDHYPGRYPILADRFDRLKNDTAAWPMLTSGFPVAISFKAEKEFKDFPHDAHLSGFEMHAKSGYLRERKLFQISCIQPGFDQDWEALRKFHEIYSEYHTQ